MMLLSVKCKCCNEFVIVRNSAPTHCTFCGELITVKDHKIARIVYTSEENK